MAEGPVRHVLFRAAGERFALPLSAVREVVLPRGPFAAVPRAGPAVRGVMNLRGRVVALVDCASLCGAFPQRLEAGKGQVLVLDRDRRALGLVVNQVLGVEPVEAPPAAAGGRPPAGPEDAVVAGVVLHGGAALTVLDAAVLAERAIAQFGPAPRAEAADPATPAEGEGAE